MLGPEAYFFVPSFSLISAAHVESVEDRLAVEKGSNENAGLTRSGTRSPQIARAIHREYLLICGNGGKPGAVEQHRRSVFQMS